MNMDIKYVVKLRICFINFDMNFGLVFVELVIISIWYIGFDGIIFYINFFIRIGRIVKRIMFVFFL